MSQNLWTKYYPEKKENRKKKLEKDLKIFLRKRKKKKSENLVMNDKKIYQKMKRNSFLNIKKKILTWEKKWQQRDWHPQRFDL